MTRRRRRRYRDTRSHHAADPQRSARLKRLLRALRENPGASSLRLQRLANIVSLSNAIGELRLQGHVIDCTRTDGVWHYWLRRRRARAAA